MHCFVANIKPTLAQTLQIVSLSVAGQSNFTLGIGVLGAGNVTILIQSPSFERPFDIFNTLEVTNCQPGYGYETASLWSHSQMLTRIDFPRVLSNALSVLQGFVSH